MRILAFDLGGTRLKAGLVDSFNGDVEHFRVVDVAGVDAERAFDRIAELGNDLTSSAAGDLEAVGLAWQDLFDGPTRQGLPAASPRPRENPRPDPKLKRALRRTWDAARPIRAGVSPRPTPTRFSSSSSGPSARVRSCTRIPVGPK